MHLEQLPINAAVDRLLRDTGHRPLSKLWAKIEILFGLLAAGGGLLLGFWTVMFRESDTVLVFASLILFALGGYLALAGSRSHMYQSNNRLAAYLAEVIRQKNSA